MWIGLNLLLLPNLRVDRVVIMIKQYVVIL